ncbi:hypothetical protein AAHA92_31465 [Salvia divinorum]|uniref:Uncharacterized protein n=1 Tax=Salvia divinorum TaxID=28513 RepID=A0ABD1FTL2_SALDI
MPRNQCVASFGQQAFAASFKAEGLPNEQTAKKALQRSRPGDRDELGQSRAESDNGGGEALVYGCVDRADGGSTDNSGGDLRRVRPLGGDRDASGLNRE